MVLAGWDTHHTRPSCKRRCCWRSRWASGSFRPSLPGPAGALQREGLVSVGHLKQPCPPLICSMRERSWLNLKMLQPSKLEAWWVGLWWWYSPRLVALQGGEGGGRAAARRLGAPGRPTKVREACWRADEAAAVAGQGKARKAGEGGARGG